MEIAEEMEIEERIPTPNHSNFKRFGLKNSIQTNFGDDYVFEIVAKYDLHLNFYFPCIVCSSWDDLKLNSSETIGRRLLLRYRLTRWSCTRRRRGSTLANAKVILLRSIGFPSQGRRLRTCCIHVRLILRSELGIPGLFSRLLTGLVIFGCSF